MDDYTIIARAWAEESPRSDTIAKSQIQPEDKRRSVARPTIHYASMGTCGQFDGCAIGARLSKNGQDIHSCRKYLPNLPFGSPFGYGQRWHWTCFSMGTHSQKGANPQMVSPKSFRREVCPTNPHLVVSVCTVCNRKAASGDLRLLVLAENLHECWPEKSGQMPPTRGSRQRKPSSNPSK